MTCGRFWSVGALERWREWESSPEPNLVKEQEAWQGRDETEYHKMQRENGNEVGRSVGRLGMVG